MSKYSDKVKARQEEAKKKGAGWHHTWCALCGRQTKVSHFGGNKEVSWCQICYGSIKMFCLDCYTKGETINKNEI